MADEARLIADIADAEDGDDGPLLVYADWLTSGGDPAGERIVIQCELERLGLKRIEDFVRWPETREEEIERVARWWRRWSVFLAAERQYSIAWQFRHLFDRTDVVSRGGEISSDPLAKRVRRFQALSLNKGDLLKLGTAVYRDRLVELELNSCSFAEPHTLRDLLELVAPTLERLVILRSTIFPMSELVQIDLPRLVELDLNGNGLSATDVKTLATARWAKQLRSLTLSWNAIGDAGLRTVLLGGAFESLDRLFVVNAELTNEAFAPAAAPWRFPKELTLGFNAGFDGVGFQRLSAIGAAERIESLNLAWTPIDDLGVKTLADAPRHLQKVRRLTLGCQRIEAAGRALIPKMQLPLEELDIGEVSAFEPHLLREILENPTFELRSLRVDPAPGIRLELARGVSAFDHPRAGLLRSLSLNQSNLGDDGARILAESSQLRRLRRLALKGNGITEETARLLASPHLGELNVDTR